MGLPSLIEFQSGADPCLRVVIWASWMAGCLALCLNVSVMHPVIGLACMLAAAASFPLWTLRSLHQRYLKLHADGTVSLSPGHGRWSPNTWRTRWYTVIRIQSGKRKWHAWISARNNSPDDYRRLGIWCQFLPMDAATGFDQETNRKTFLQ